MTISFNTALNAYNNVAKLTNNSVSENSPAASGQASGFSGIFEDGTKHAVSSLRSAEKLSSMSLVKQADITDVVTAVTNAEVTLRTVIAVRDRLIAAHQEIMRMPI